VPQQKLTEEQVTFALMNVKDPEIDCNIVDLGLVYGISVDGEGNVGITMTFTTIACPYGPALVDEVRGKIRGLEGVRTVDVQVTFDPPWKPSEEVLAALGL